jgi:hypothetical protein
MKRRLLLVPAATLGLWLIPAAADASATVTADTDCVGQTPEVTLTFSNPVGVPAVVTVFDGDYVLPPFGDVTITGPLGNPIGFEVLWPEAGNYLQVGEIDAPVPIEGCIALQLPPPTTTTAPPPTTAVTPLPPIVSTIPPEIVEQSVAPPAEPEVETLAYTGVDTRTGLIASAFLLTLGGLGVFLGRRRES